MDTKKNKKGFTLIELIVVIVILSILGTISIIAFQGYNIKSRDTVRISDINNLTKSLELFQVKTGKYPIPSNGVDIIYSGSTVWNQGTIGDSVINNIGKINKKPVDPLSSNEYTYSTTNSQKEYQIGAILEGDNQISQNNILINKAISASNILSLVKGNYESKGIMVRNGNNCYTISAPSIILSEIGENSTLDIMGNHNFVLNKSNNIASSYKQFYDDATRNNGTNFNVSVVFDQCNIENETQLNTYISNLQTAYTQYQGTQDEYMFDKIINNTEDTINKIEAVNSLQKNGITIIEELVTNVYSGTSSDSTPEQVVLFFDTFTDPNGTYMNTHTSEIGGGWSGNPVEVAWNMGNYNNFNLFGIPQINALGGLERYETHIIQSNQLMGTVDTYDKIYVNTNLGVNDYIVNFDIVNIGGDFNMCGGTMKKLSTIGTWGRRSDDPDCSSASSCGGYGGDCSNDVCDCYWWLTSENGFGITVSLRESGSDDGYKLLIKNDSIELTQDGNNLFFSNETINDGTEVSYQIKGSNIKLYLNNVLKIDINDSTISSGGSVGLMIGDETPIIDNFEITENK